MRKILFLCILIGITSCKEKPTAEVGQEQPEDFSVEINYKPTRTVSLQPQAQEKVAQWLAYATAQNQINEMKSATGSELMEASQPLIQIMQALNNSVPDSLKVPAVQARINVLLTKAHILRQQSIKQNKDAEEIFKTANAIITEFDNFKIQLNEVYIKTPEDFELELDREFETAIEQDTILPDSLERDSI